MYYYLAEFGIGISELDLGIETIFIYSAPPVVWAAKTFWYVIVLIALLIAVIVAKWHRIPLRLRTGLEAIGARIKKISPIARGLGVCVLLILFAILSAPLVKKVANDRASEKWDRVGVRIQATVDKPEKTFAQYEDYKSCMDRRVLDLIFADRDGYYMLCISEINETNGVVYEVRRDASTLASVRSIHRGHHTRGK